MRHKEGFTMMENFFPVLFFFFISGVCFAIARNNLVLFKGNVLFSFDGLSTKGKFVGFTIAAIVYLIMAVTGALK